MLVEGLPQTTGQKTTAGSTSVAQASDNIFNANQISKPATSADTQTAAVNTAVVITYATAGAGVSNVLGMVVWSYNAAPTGGNLQVEDGSGNVVFKVDITAAGPGYFEFIRPIKGTPNTALIVTLAAAGAAVTGRLNARKWTE